MSDSDTLNESERAFLIELCQQTQGDPARQVSSAAVGAALGLDKNTASKVSEELIGWGLVAVKTLSGGIGITAEGAAEARRLGGGGETAEPVLGKEPVVDAQGRSLVEQSLAKLKAQVEVSNLSYSAMEELVADIRTIEAQLISPRPKTLIIRECLVGIRGILQKSGPSPGVQLITALIGEASG
jgi:hypothetical protein